MTLEKQIEFQRQELIRLKAELYQAEMELYRLVQERLAEELEFEAALSKIQRT